jgi:Ca-activated chloride channel homolog
MLSALAIYGQQGEDSNRTLSPYFFVKSEDPGIDKLPLKSTKAEARIVGVIADVTVTQVYRNEGNKPLEAIYIFPASMRAAVFGMKMSIGERTIVATIKEREEVRRDYEQAKQQGKSATLLEQHRPNDFQMNVANILPEGLHRNE